MRKPEVRPAPKLWPGQTIVCLASGPSLTQADVDFVRGKARVIAINRTYQIAKWADVLYACDQRFWNACNGAKDFPGLKYSLLKWGHLKPVDVHLLKDTGDFGLELTPSGLRTGANSGFQALNLAVHFGAKRIVLLGYDMQWTKGKKHWHPPYPWGDRGADPTSWLPYYDTIAKPLKALGIEVINCSRETALKCFPWKRLEDVFPDVEERRIA